MYWASESVLRAVGLLGLPAAERLAGLPLAPSALKRDSHSLLAGAAVMMEYVRSSSASSSEFLQPQRPTGNATCNRQSNLQPATQLATGNALLGAGYYHSTHSDALNRGGERLQPAAPLWVYTARVRSAASETDACRPTVAPLGSECIADPRATRW